MTMRISAAAQVSLGRVQLAEISAARATVSWHILKEEFVMRPGVSVAEVMEAKDVVLDAQLVQLVQRRSRRRCFPLMRRKSVVNGSVFTPRSNGWPSF